MGSQHKIEMPATAAAIGFRPEFLDFERGIRVGNLQDNERITRILKMALEHHFRQPFVTERWGRGVFWQWIGYLPRANRTAKPISSRVSFGCSKFFLMVDTEEKIFKCGMQVERGYIKAPSAYRSCELATDWDWHRLLKQLHDGSMLEKQLRRLVLREDFLIYAGSWEEETACITKENYAGATKLRRSLEAARRDRWAGFQLYYPFTAEEVLACPGIDLVEAILAVFHEVTPAMNVCMQVPLA